MHLLPNEWQLKWDVFHVYVLRDISIESENKIVGHRFAGPKVKCSNVFIESIQLWNSFIRIISWISNAFLPLIVNKLQE